MYIYMYVCVCIDVYNDRDNTNIYSIRRDPPMYCTLLYNTSFICTYQICIDCTQNPIVYICTLQTKKETKHKNIYKKNKNRNDKKSCDLVRGCGVYSANKLKKGF